MPAQIQATLKDFAIWLVAWLPFGLCGLALAREYAGGQTRRYRVVLALCMTLSSLCIWLALCAFGAIGQVRLAVMLAVMAAWVFILARCTGLPPSYTLYCLLGGVFLAAVMMATVLDGLLAEAPPDWVVLVLALCFSLLWSGLCIHYLKKLVFPFQEQLCSARRFLLDVSGLIYFGLVLFFYYGGFVLVPGLFANAARLLCYVLCLLGIWAAYHRNARLLQAISQYVDQRRRSEALEHSLQLQQVQYAAVAQQTELTRRLRHDLRHHQLLIDQYIRNGERDNLVEYIQEFQGQQELCREEPSVCAHPVADMLARYYLEQLRCLGTKLDVVLDIRESCSIPGPDLCVVLGNCLENTLEAVRSTEEGRRFFRVRAAQNGPMLTLVAENSYAGELVRDGAGFLSTKRPGSRGIGLGSIESIVEKYHGSLKTEAKDGIFRISFLLFGEGEG